MARDLMGGEIRRVLVDFHPEGSLATTHESQGSDMGLFGGFLGWDAADHRLVRSKEALAEAGIQVEIRVTGYQASHPNSYRMTLEGPSGHHTMTAISTGGGMVEVTEVDGVPLSLPGDRFVLLAFLEDAPAASPDVPDALQRILEEAGADEFLAFERATGGLFQANASLPLPVEFLEKLGNESGVVEVISIQPVLPILSRDGMKVPFLTCAELLAFNEGRNLDLWELAVHYEAARGGISHDEVTGEMDRIVSILEEAVREGLAGTEYADRILGPQAGSFRQHMEDGDLLDGGILNPIIRNVTALMEVKSSMGVIVAAPTAGACGALPGACIGAAQAMGLDREAVTRGMLAAGIVGVLIAARSTFAAEVCGCQAECGAGSGMAAAALVTLAEGTTEQALTAASMALQNTLGMICDPVANRVEVPCLGRNVLAASNALACANMALAGFDPVIPLDEVIETMDAVGKSLPRELRCTALGGLSMTPTARRIEDTLKNSP